MVGGDGQTLTDPRAVLEGLTRGTCALTPLGGIGEEGAGYKGYGYATVVEVLSAALSNAKFMKDLTGLDACGLVIVSDKGEQFMPAEMAVPGITLAAGQKVRFGYTDMPDAMSACMAGKIVRITCLEVLGGGSSEVPNAKDCLDIADPIQPGQGVRRLSKKVVDRRLGF